MSEKQLESGLWIAEEEKAPSPPEIPAAEPITCIRCGQQSMAPHVLFGMTDDGFMHWSPTCKHDPFWTCKECRPPNCPVCGRGEFKT